MSHGWSVAMAAAWECYTDFHGNVHSWSGKNQEQPQIPWLHCRNSNLDRAPARLWREGRNSVLPQDSTYSHLAQSWTLHIPYLQSANCWLPLMVSGITAAGWTELCKATPGSCCHVEGSRICWVPPGQACCKTTKKTHRFTRLQLLPGGRGLFQAINTLV